MNLPVLHPISRTYDITYAAQLRAPYNRVLESRYHLAYSDMALLPDPKPAGVIEDVAFVGDDLHRSEVKS